MKRIVLFFLLCSCSFAENILIVGDSYTLFAAADDLGGSILDGLRASGDEVKIQYRNKGVQCGENGGALLNILNSLECIDFQWADKVILMAGYWDANPPRAAGYGTADKRTRSERAELIRDAWDSQKREGAEFYWLDTAEWAERGKAENFLIDGVHMNAHGYRLMFDSIGLIATKPATPNEEEGSELAQKGA